MNFYLGKRNVKDVINTPVTCHERVLYELSKIASLSMGFHHSVDRAPGVQEIMGSIPFWDLDIFFLDFLFVANS